MRAWRFREFGDIVNLKLDDYADPKLQEEEVLIRLKFAALNPEITDAIHMLSWFRDQVLHPHETQHSYEEIEALLREEGFVVERTSINGFKPMPGRDKLIQLEKQLEEKSNIALTKKRKYFPGFFVVWARRADEQPAER